MTESIVSLDAVELSRRIHARDVSCREVMDAFLQHIHTLNPAVNAIVSLREPEPLLQEAGERDRELSAGTSRGWMHGFPHAVKDLAPAADLPFTRGSPLFRDFVADTDASFVSRLRASGAVVIGKTNTPEFGYGSQTYNPVFGATRNPYDPSRTCGGSSGGAAAALALRMLPVADGSDMGGSLRNPAGYCNVFGFRTTPGRIPKGPSTELFLNQLSVNGPMGRTVSDVARLLAVMAGRDEREPLTLDGDPDRYLAPLERDVAGTRIGWLADFEGYLAMEPGVLDVCEGALKTLEGAGCRVDSPALEFDPRSLWGAWLVLRQSGSAGELGALYADPEKRALMKPEVIWEIENGASLTAGDVYRASEVRSAWYQAVRELFERYDFLALPSAQVFPFDVETHWPAQIDGRPMDTYHRWMEVSIPATFAGCPAMGAPAGFSRAGLPMGIQFIGRPRREFDVLQLAFAYERLTKWTANHPPPLFETTRRRSRSGEPHQTGGTGMQDGKEPG